TRIDGNCPYNYTIIREWTATDNCSNSETTRQVVHVRDTQAPDISGVPADITVECSAIPPAPQIGSDITASDNCDTNPVLTFAELTAPGSCPYEYVLTRIWSATDVCGNT